MPIVNRQTIVVHHSLAGAIQDFSKNLFIDFTPSSVILREVSYGEGAGGTDLHGVFAPWSNGVIGTFVDDTNNGFTSNPGTSFKINNPGMFMNGDIMFRVRRLNNSTSASTATGKISLTLEFIYEVYPEPSSLVNEMKELIFTLKNTQTTDDYPFDEVKQIDPIETPPLTGKVAELEAMEMGDTPITPNKVVVGGETPETSETPQGKKKKHHLKSM